MLNSMKVLIGVLIVVGGLAYWVASNNHNDNVQSKPLLPSWQANDALINAIDQITLSQDEEKVTLIKTAEVWQIENGFYASMEPLFELIQSLKNAQIIEAKTANPARHEQLELAAGDLRVNLYQTGELKHALYIGKKTTAGLTFVRHADNDQTYTASGLNAISLSPDSWKMKTVLDIDADEVQAASIKPTESEMVAVRRNVNSGELEITDIPEGFQLQESAVLDQLAGGLSRLMIDEALTVESWSKDDLDKAGRVVKLSAMYELKSGTEVNIDVYQQDDAYYLTIDSNYYPQYKGWVMKIAEYKFKAMNRKLSEFIEPISSEDGIGDDVADETVKEISG